MNTNDFIKYMTNAELVGMAHGIAVNWLTTYDEDAFFMVARLNMIREEFAARADEMGLEPLFRMISNELNLEKHPDRLEILMREFLSLLGPTQRPVFRGGANC